MKNDLKKLLIEQKQSDTTELQSVMNKLVKDADMKVKDKELKKQVEQSQSSAQTNSNS